MLRNVLLKSLRDRRRGLIGWSTGLLLLCAWIAAFYPTFRRSAADLNKFLERAPEAIRGLMGSADLTTGVGYLQAEVFSVWAPVLLIVFAAGFGGSAIAGEERAGTMEILLSQPITRRRVVAEKAAAMAAGTLALSCVLAGGLVVGSSLAGMHVAVGNLIATTLTAGLVAVVFGMVALLVGAATGNKGLASGVAGGLALFLYLVNAFAETVTALRPVRALSPFHWLLKTTPLENGIALSSVGLTIVVAVVCAGVAAIGFERRDLAV